MNPAIDHSQATTHRWTSGLADSLRRFGARYGIPMLVTETSIEGSDALRSAWVRESVAEIRSLVTAGVDVRGWTWWPVFDFVDWSYASGGRNVEEFTVAEDVVRARESAGTNALHDAAPARKDPYLRRMGLIRLEEQPDGTLARVPTPAADAYRELASAPASAASLPG